MTNMILAIAKLLRVENEKFVFDVETIDHQHRDRQVIFSPIAADVSSGAVYLNGVETNAMFTVKARLDNHGSLAIVSIVGNANRRRDYKTIPISLKTPNGRL